MRELKSPLEKAFEKFEEETGYKFMELVENKELRKEFYNSNITVKDIDSEEIQNIYGRNIHKNYEE